MKHKFFIPIAFSILIGLFFGKVFFDVYDSSSLTVFDEKDKIYLLQIGVYSSKSNMKSSFANYSKYLYLKENDGYHLYIGITKNSEIAKRIKEYYTKKGYSIYIKEIIENNKAFLSILSEYDRIILLASDNDMREIEKIIISNYKEMVLNNEA